MFNHVLVPTDGSTLSIKAIAKAVEYAGESGARLTFLYATPLHKGYFFGEGSLDRHIAPEVFAKAMAHQGDEALAQAGACARAAGVRHELLSEPADSPHEAIIAAAIRMGCDAIFMASHGRMGVSGLLLGSETTKVLIYSTIPVLVIR